MTKHVPASLALVSLLSAGASWAHGSMEVPVSRVYNCYKEGPESPDTAACKAAIAAGGTQGLYDWNGVRQGNANDQHRALIPDGKLCSANNEVHKGIDLARSDWPARRIVPGTDGKFEFVYHVTAPHATKYFRFYVTRAGYNPSLPLKWSDLESTPFCEVNSLTPVNSRYRVRCPLPAGKQGRHVIYNIWQRSDSPEAFYACIDVDLGATALSHVDTGWKELDSVQAREELPAGTRVTFRVFDRDGRDAELHDLRLTETSTAANWLLRLAEQVNNSSRYVRVGTPDEKGKILPIESAQGNSVYVQEDGYRFQIDIEKPSTTPEKSCNH